MGLGIDKERLLSKLVELIAQQHDKMDGATTSPDFKAKAQGYIEALYQVESIVINWDLT